MFIDGLDEYEGIDADVAELFGKSAASPNIKACVSSRPHVVFEDAFASCRGLRLQDLTYNDIQNYVAGKLGQNERMKALAISEPVHTPESHT